MPVRIDLLPDFKFTSKMVEIMEFTSKIGKAGYVEKP
jgi:hypothetical protein